MVVMRTLLAVIATVSGLQGFVHKGPTTPVCRTGRPCEAPAQVTLVFRRSVFRGGVLVPVAGLRPVRVRSDAAGRYRLLLRPGYYAATTVEKIGPRRNLRPHAVHVRRGHVDRLDFSIDTGIR